MRQAQKWKTQNRKQTFDNEKGIFVNASERRISFCTVHVQKINPGETFFRVHFWKTAICRNLTMTLTAEKLNNYCSFAELLKVYVQLCMYLTLHSFSSCLAVSAADNCGGVWWWMFEGGSFGNQRLFSKPPLSSAWWLLFPEQCLYGTFIHDKWLHEANVPFFECPLFVDTMQLQSITGNGELTRSEIIRAPERAQLPQCCHRC